MAIIRTKREGNFTVISNAVYADNGLSFQAMGLLSYLLSKPDNWTVNVPVLCQVTQGTAKRSGQEAVYSMLAELVSAGFVVRKKYANGKVDYFIFDTPQTQPNQEKPNQEKPNQGKPNQEKPNQGKPNQGLPEVLINTERQQELNIKQELNCTGGADAPPAAPPPADLTPVKAKPSAKKSEPDPDHVRTWQAYAKAYRDRYGVLPAANAKTRGQTAQFVRLVGKEVAPELAAFYVWHSSGYFVQRRHDFGCLLQSYQQVLTDMQRGEQMTATKARQTERQSSNMQNAAALIARYKREEQEACNG